MSFIEGGPKIMSPNKTAEILSICAGYLINHPANTAR
jgi:hypothetical protein